MAPRNAVKAGSARQPRHVIKTSAGGALVTIETTTGIHVATIGRAAAIKAGWLKPKTQGNSKRSRK